jgi:hypothetical protein
MRQHCLSTCLFTSYACIELSSSPGRRPLFHLGPLAGPLNPSHLPPADKRTPTVRPSPTSDPHHAVPRSLDRTRPGRTVPCRSAALPHAAPMRFPSLTTNRRPFQSLTRNGCHHHDINSRSFRPSHQCRHRFPSTACRCPFLFLPRCIKGMPEPRALAAPLRLACGSAASIRACRRRTSSARFVAPQCHRTRAQGHRHHELHLAETEVRLLVTKPSDVGVLPAARRLEPSLLANVAKPFCSPRSTPPGAWC